MTLCNLILLVRLLLGRAALVCRTSNGVGPGRQPLELLDLLLNAMRIHSRGACAQPTHRRGVIEFAVIEIVEYHPVCIRRILLVHLLLLQLIPSDDGHECSCVPLRGFVSSEVDIYASADVGIITALDRNGPVVWSVTHHVSRRLCTWHAVGMAPSPLQGCPSQHSRFRLVLALLVVATVHIPLQPYLCAVCVFPGVVVTRACIERGDDGVEVGIIPQMAAGGYMCPANRTFATTFAKGPFHTRSAEAVRTGRAFNLAHGTPAHCAPRIEAHIV
mmetsp:Transcript_24325/g.60452  ORF Transcript_24325/g.60452 Transcript_24325/m.60452 type:complete len:274 (-) Transcript_24325:232-1053(-)